MGIIVGRAAVAQAPILQNCRCHLKGTSQSRSNHSIMHLLKAGYTFCIYSPKFHDHKNFIFLSPLEYSETVFDITRGFSNKYSRRQVMAQNVHLNRLGINQLVKLKSPILNLDRWFDRIGASILRSHLICEILVTPGPSDFNNTRKH